MAAVGKLFEPSELRKTVHALKNEGDLFEIRCLEANGKKLVAVIFMILKPWWRNYAD